jgi:hypothetical protein
VRSIEDVRRERAEVQRRLDQHELASVRMTNRDIRAHQRTIHVDILALQLLQVHHGNPLFSFLTVSDSEGWHWRMQAETIIPPVRPAVLSS